MDLNSPVKSWTIDSYSLSLTAYCSSCGVLRVLLQRGWSGRQPGWSAGSQVSRAGSQLAMLVGGSWQRTQRMLHESRVVEGALLARAQEKVCYLFLVEKRVESTPESRCDLLDLSKLRSLDLSKALGLHFAPAQHKQAWCCCLYTRSLRYQTSRSSAALII